MGPRALRYCVARYRHNLGTLVSALAGYLEPLSRCCLHTGFEQQPKSFTQPKILLLNIELELKAEKENAEIRLDDPAKYQSIVDAEWNIIYDKLAKCVASGAQIVLSRLAIGDLGTQVRRDDE